MIQNVENKQRFSARSLAKIAGTIISMGPAIGPLTRMFTRKMYGKIDMSSSWDGAQAMDSEVQEELRFWADNLNCVNGYAIKAQHAFTKIVYTDASEHGYGGYILEKLGNTIAQGTFSEGERSQSSTYRELLAVKYVLQSFEQDLKHETILWHSDNMNTAKIINVGSSKNHIQKIALDIYQQCVASDIRIISKWIPREENTLAASISKHNDTDDWSIDNETFTYIQERFGRFDIDRFASATNNKTRRFDARFHCPHAETINTFTADWGKDFNWLCPPTALVGTTLKHAKACRATGVLFVPEWTSAYYWPLLTPDGKKFYSFVRDYLVIDPYFINGCKLHTVFSGFAKFRSLALLIQYQ